jgi:hypothetical protein
MYFKITSFHDDAQIYFECDKQLESLVLDFDIVNNVSESVNAEYEELEKHKEEFIKQFWLEFEDRLYDENHYYQLVGENLEHLTLDVIKRRIADNQIFNEIKNYLAPELKRFLN